MKQVPYQGNPGNACALACHTMIGKYLLPGTGISFDSFGALADWHTGYVVWAFPIWKWLMDRGVSIYSYDVLDIDAWASEGVEGLKKSVSEEEYQFYTQNTYNLDQVTKELEPIHRHPNFQFERKTVTWDDIVDGVRKPGICELTLDGCKLHRSKGFNVHRVVLIDIDDTHVTFHDPLKDNSGAYTKESINHFRAAIDSLSGPELVRYESSNAKLKV